MKIKRFVVIGLIALLVVGAVGALAYRAYAQGSDDGETEEVGAPDDGEKANEEGDNAPVPADAAITANEAKAIAEEAYPGAKAREVEFEREGGVDAWEVELDNGVEVQVDPNTGEILNAGG
ncbi:MAG: PepSY domain-containing protein [Anaerolineales bacterium]|nr:PepSY domain-containing protein [Anaerolineales bacterium]